MRARLTPILALAALALLAGCGTPKPHYPAAAAAQEQLRAAEANAPEGDPVGTHRRLIEQMQREGLWYASLAHIDQLEQSAGPSAAVLRMRADALRHTGQLSASEAAYKRLVAAPQAADAAAGLHGLGLLAGGRGDFAQAVSWLAQARQRTPTDARLLGDLGYAQLRAGRIDEARVPLMQAAQLQPADVRAQLNLAAWLLASGQVEQAEGMMAGAAVNEEARAAVREAALRAREAAQPSASAAMRMAPAIGPVPAAVATVGVAAPTALPPVGASEGGASEPVLPAALASHPADTGPALAVAAMPAPLQLRGAGWQESRRIRIGVQPIDGGAALAASASP